MGTSCRGNDNMRGKQQINNKSSPLQSHLPLNLFIFMCPKLVPFLIFSWSTSFLPSQSAALLSTGLRPLTSEIDMTLSFAQTMETYTLLVLVSSLPSFFRPFLSHAWGIWAVFSNFKSTVFSKPWGSNTQTSLNLGCLNSLFVFVSCSVTKTNKHVINM